MPDVLIDAADAHVLESGGIAYSLGQDGMDLGPQRVPGRAGLCRARPWMVAASRRSWPIAHRIARVLSRLRAAQILGSCSRNETTGRCAHGRASGICATGSALADLPRVHR